MKKVQLSLLVVLLFASTLFAGEFSGTGMKLGLNYSRFIGRDIPGKGVNYIPGFALGGFASYKIDDMFSIQQEIFLTTKGSQINTIGDVNLNNLFIYFQIPLLAKATFLSEAKIRPTIFLGPAFGIKVLALNDVGMPEDIRNIDLGLIFGAGIEFWKISMDIRYDGGLLNFDQSANDIDLKNSTISIMVGHSF